MLRSIGRLFIRKKAHFLSGLVLLVIVASIAAITRGENDSVKGVFQVPLQEVDTLQDVETPLQEVETPQEVDTPQDVKTPLHEVAPYENVIKYLRDERHLTEENSRVFSKEPGKQDITDILDFDRDHLKVIYQDMIDTVYQNTDLDGVDWEKLAYVFYATSESHVCNVLMKFAELRNYGSRAQFELLIGRHLMDEAKKPALYKQLTDFAKQHKVIFKPVDVIHMEGGPEVIWENAFTKLLVFNETQYDRIIYMDSDAVLPNGHMDELFFVPPCRLAVPNGYWLTESLLHNKAERYNMKDYGFVPMTTEQRQARIDEMVKTNITAFLDPNTGKLPVFKNGKAPLKDRVNEKNFYTNLFNSLPNDPVLDEYQLTDFLMVIQPSPELFARVQHSLDIRTTEFDMDLIQRHVFPPQPCLDMQKESGQKDLTYDDRLAEVPEMIVLPHSTYAVLTMDLNRRDNHDMLMADTQDLAFMMQRPEKPSEDVHWYWEIDHLPNLADIIYDNVKYLHFSDHPIPKPWFKKDIFNGYMGARFRCPSHPDFSSTDGRVKPRWTINDCGLGERWERAHEMFAKSRKDVCGLDLIETDKDTYVEIVN